MVNAQELLLLINFVNKYLSTDVSHFFLGQIILSIPIAKVLSIEDSTS
jgi:hypothetical protein